MNMRIKRNKIKNRASDLLIITCLCDIILKVNSHFVEENINCI